MAVTVKRVALWRKQVENRPGALAETLAPLAAAGANLRVVMGYALPHEPGRSVVELFPVTGRRATTAAREAGLAESDIPCLLAEGDDRPGLGQRMAQAIAEQGVNLSFLMAETVGRKFSAIFGFASGEDAEKASRAIRAAARPAARRPGRRR